MKESVLNLLDEIKKLQSGSKEDCALPQNTFYLNDGILCMEREKGESRYPYEMDGLTIWVHSTGYIDSCESTLTYFKQADLREEPCIGFWGGEKNNGKYFPVSVTGASRQMYEDDNIKRYTVFLKRCAYYITETENIIYALRVSVTSKKQIVFKSTAINKCDTEKEVYIVSYLEPLLRMSENENFWGLLTRYGNKYDNGSYKIYTRQGIENIAVIRSCVNGENYSLDGTVSKDSFLGAKGRTLLNSLALKNGYFERAIDAVNTTDMPIVSNILKCGLQAEKSIELMYVIDFTHNGETAQKQLNMPINEAEIEVDLKEQEKIEEVKLNNLNIRFGKFSKYNINNNVFNRFLKNVQKQVDFCALGKNYAGNLIGIRDVFQQLESALMWNTNESRKKIITALNYIMVNGRSPRQFSIPPKENVVPEFDMREFIDQGLWVISALHSYLCFTDDFSILSEKCSYYEVMDEEKNIIGKSEHSGNVLEHLLKITDYLIGNIDENTKCLKILYGDWNDAVCGLGASQNGGKFGNGVSVMATLQMYQALSFMSNILKHIGKYTEKCSEYAKCREDIKNGLLKYAIENDENGTRHIIHGWGDKRSYKIASLCDSDGKCRYSVNPNSFWCISGMIENDESIKSDILKAFDILDSKYGIKTFEPYFPYGMEGVGRITTITPGTYENACTYVHATMFAAAALFIIEEPKRAWDQLAKAITITHENATLTPFVMPNSYCYNEEYHIDGESMGDWFTGSGTVFMRDIVKYAFGIKPTLDGLTVDFPGFFPSDEAELEMEIKGTKIKLVYQNNHQNIRKYFVNGKEQKNKIFINNNDLKNELVIKIAD